MSNSLSPKSPANAAALDITMAVIAKTEFVIDDGLRTPEDNGKRAAAFANALFNGVLENLQKK